MLPSQESRNHHWKPKTPWYHRPDYELIALLFLFGVGCIFFMWALTELFVELKHAPL